MLKLGFRAVLKLGFRAVLKLGFRAQFTKHKIKFIYYYPIIQYITSFLKNKTYDLLGIIVDIK